MKNKIAAFGKWVEFQSINGGFSYSDDDRTLRYVGNAGETCTITAPDGCLIRFFIHKGANNYCIVPERFGPGDVQGFFSGEKK